MRGKRPDELRGLLDLRLGDGRSGLCLGLGSLGAGGLHFGLRLLGRGGAFVGLQLLGNGVELGLGVPAIGTTGLLDFSLTQRYARRRRFDVEDFRQIGHAELELGLVRLRRGCGLGGCFGILFLGHMTISCVRG